MMRFICEEAAPDVRKSETMNQCYHNEASKYGMLSRSLSRERRKGESIYDRKIPVLIEA